MKHLAKSELNQKTDYKKQPSKFTKFNINSQILKL